MIGVRKKVAARVGSMSLIGVGGEPPYGWGNYFDLRNGPRVWNFWAENLQALVENGTLDDGMVDIIEYPSGGCIIDDRRIPKDWYYNKLCFTGGSRPTKEEAQEIYTYLGDPTNEYEQFVAPVSYYKKRGGDYNPKSGIIKYTIKAKSRKIPNVTFTTTGIDSACVYAPYVPLHK
jgi:hypothetical protein